MRVGGGSSELGFCSGGGGGGARRGEKGLSRVAVVLGCGSSDLRPATREDGRGLRRGSCVPARMEVAGILWPARMEAEGIRQPAAAWPRGTVGGGGGGLRMGEDESAAARFVAE